jgi:hypothetical protein
MKDYKAMTLKPNRKDSQRTCLIKRKVRSIRKLTQERHNTRKRTNPGSVGKNVLRPSKYTTNPATIVINRI